MVKVFSIVRRGGVGAVLVLWITLIALAAIAISLPDFDLGLPDPNRTDPSRSLISPGGEHLFGTDELGRSVFSRVFHAARIDLGIALFATISAFTVGTAVGAFAAYVGGIADHLLMRLLEITQSLPGILLGLFLVVLLPDVPGFVTLIFAVALINIPVYARLTRSELLPLVASPVTAAARLSGVSHVRILSVYLFPQALTAAVAYLPVQAGFSVAVAAGFGFLGVGVRPPQAEWGMMIREGLSGLIYLDAWWPVLFPAFFLAVTILGFYTLGNALLRRTASWG